MDFVQNCRAQCFCFIHRYDESICESNDYSNYLLLSYDQNEWPWTKDHAIQSILMWNSIFVICLKCIYLKPFEGFNIKNCNFENENGLSLIPCSYIFQTKCQRASQTRVLKVLYVDFLVKFCINGWTGQTLLRAHITIFCWPSILYTGHPIVCDYAIVTKEQKLQNHSIFILVQNMKEHEGLITVISPRSIWNK